MHLVGPYDGHDALIVVSEENAEIVDALVDGYFLQKLPDGGDILMHWAFKGGDRLEKLIEQDPEAMPELRRRILHRRP